MLIRLWRNLRLSDLSAMYRSCIEPGEKEILLNKINYHKEKLKRL